MSNFAVADATLGVSARASHAYTSPSLTTDEMIQNLYDQSQTFAGNVAQEDDVTIVVLRRLPDIIPES